MGEPIQAVYLFGAAYALYGIGLTAARRRDAGELRFRRGPALGGFFTEGPDTSPLRRPSAAPTRFTFASRPLAVGQSYAARQAA